MRELISKFKYMMLPAILGAILLGFSMHYADASPTTYLARVGNMVGIKDVPVRGSIDYTFRSVGVPDQCRNEAHDILKQYIIYGLEDDAQFDPRVTILCDFNISKAQTNPSGFMGKAIGTRGSIGGLKYIKFENAVRKVEKYTLDIKPKAQNTSSLWNRMLHFVAATPPQGQLACGANGNCSQSRFLATPVSGPITSRFGNRKPPKAGASSNHAGLDYGSPCGTPVVASANGKVKSASSSGNAGNLIEIIHGEGYMTKYMHLQSMSVSSGSTVTRGQVIGTVGTTGNSTGCHLHFEIRKDGLALNPKDWLGDGPAPQLNTAQLSALGGNIAAIDQNLIALSSYEGGALNDGKKTSGYCSTSVNGKCPRGGLEEDAYWETIGNEEPMHGDHEGE